MIIQSLTDDKGKALTNVEVCKYLKNIEAAHLSEFKNKNNMHTAYDPLVSSEVLSFINYVLDTDDDSVSQLRFQNNLKEIK